MFGRLSRTNKDHLLSYTFLAQFQKEDNAKRAKLDLLSDTTVSYMTFNCNQNSLKDLNFVNSESCQAFSLAIVAKLPYKYSIIVFKIKKSRQQFMSKRVTFFNG